MLLLFWSVREGVIKWIDKNKLEVCRFVNNPDTTTKTFNQYRQLLFSIAYRMLGSATDAEDIVQDAFVRWMQGNSEEVQSPKSYLSAVVTRLCIDQLRSARVQREVYVGPWLPEPISTNLHQTGSGSAMQEESLSYAFLVLLENLGPLERAVFLLHEVFEYEYAEIATIVERSEANCRQILHRAHQHLEQRRSRFEVPYEDQERITNQFLRASVSGDMQELLNLLTEDIVFTGDGGGKVRVAHNVRGRDKVARGTQTGLRPLLPYLVTRIQELNGQPAIVAYRDGRPYGVMLFEVEGKRIRRIYTVVNPDKLRGIRL